MNGGQGFSRRLRTAKRRARLSGRRLSAGEMSGMVRGEAEAASSRLYRAKGLQLQEKGLTQQQSQFEAAQTQRGEQFGERMGEMALSREQTGTLHAERLAEMKRAQEAGFEHQAGMQETGITSAETMHAAGITSAETMHAAGITSAETLHAAGITSQEAMHAAGIMSAEEMHAEGIISAEELARLGREQEAGQFTETMGFREKELTEDIRQFNLLYGPPTTAAPMPHGLTQEMWDGMSEAERLAWLRRQAPGETTSPTYTGHGPV